MDGGKRKPDPSADSTVGHLGLFCKMLVYLMLACPITTPPYYEPMDSYAVCCKWLAGFL